MTVLPDILLPGAGLAASRSAPTAPTENARSAPRDDARSFADIYADERQAVPEPRAKAPAPRDEHDRGQARAAERGQAPAHARRHERVGESAAPASDREAGENDPAVAEAGKGGKQLPPDAVADAPDGEEDPLALLGLGLTEAQPAEAGETTEAQLAAELAAEPEAAESAEEGVVPTLASSASAPAAASNAGEAVSKGEPSLKGALQAAAQPQADATAEAAAEVEAQPDLVQLADVSDEPAPTVSAQVLSKLAEGGQPGQQNRESNRESFANRLNGLTQAIAQHSGNAAPRPAPLVPGQPLALQQPAVSEAVVDRVMWMSSQNLKSAEIQLDPAELGRMEVRIEMLKDQTQVTFLSPHANVRDALEGQMQRLREMFTQQGLNLADVNVSDQSQARGWQGQGGDQQGRGNGRGNGLAGEEEVALSGTSEIAANRQGGQRGLVDYYA